MANGENKDQETGRLTGLGAGAITGAQLGTALIPIPIVGTFAGAVIGGALGSRVGQKLAPTILGAVDGLFNSQAEGQAGTSGVPSSEGDAAPDLLSQLERLGQLKTQGLLTEEEFTAAKAQLLNS
jgi:phage tail tape-measure protein